MRRPARAVSKPPSALAVVLLLLLTGCGTTEPAARPTPTDSATPTATPARFTTETCADLVLLGVRGQGQSTQTHQGVGAQVQGIVRATVHRLDDGSTVRLEGVPYPSGANATYDADVATGVRMVRHRIRTLAGACPSSRIGLVGYSQGAQVVHVAAVRGVFSLVAMVGDPLRDPKDPLTTFSFGTDLSGRGNAGPGPGFPIGQRRGVVEVCVKGDNVCDAPLTGRVGPVSATHRDFYGRPASASAAGSRLARVVAVGPHA